MQILHTCRSVLTQHIDKATEITRKKSTRLPDGRKPTTARDDNAEARPLANALLSQIVVDRRTRLSFREEAAH
jgi:hypothetical protein